MKRHETRDDAGFTVIELMITLLISTLVMGAILGMLEGQMRVETRIDAFATNQEELRDTLVTLQHDLRSSQPPSTWPGATSADMMNTLRLNVYTDASAATTPVQWSRSGNDLVREEGTPPVVTHRLRGLSPSQDQIFFYFNTRQEMKLNPAPPDLPASPDDIANCTVRVQVILIAAPNAGPQAAPIRSDVQIRNRTTPGAGCPVSSQLVP